MEEKVSNMSSLQNSNVNPQSPYLQNSSYQQKSSSQISLQSSSNIGSQLPTLPSVTIGSISSINTTMTTNTVTAPTPRTKTLNLWIHVEGFSKQDFIMNPDCFPGIKPGQLLGIYHQNEELDISKNLIVQVSPFDKEIIGKEKPIWQVHNC